MVSRPAIGGTAVLVARSVIERCAAPVAHAAPAGLNKAPRFTLLNTMGGDGRENFRRLVEDLGLPTLLNHALPLRDTTRTVL